MEQREQILGPHQSAAGEPWLFRSRTDAGARLAASLEHLRGRNPLVLGIARGGLSVAREVARRLGAELDVFVARKLGLPGQEELAIGAVASDGICYVDRELIVQLGISNASLAHLARVESVEAQRRERLYRQGQPPRDVAGRIVVVVDDGLATGATMRVALRSLRQRAPKRLVVAVPVGAIDTCGALGALADELVCPHRPDPFHAVGRYYRSFEQVSDDQVMRILREQHPAELRETYP
jgi:predicted phosphoribosyltransferase